MTFAIEQPKQSTCVNEREQRTFSNNESFNARYTRNAYLKKAMKLDDKFAPGDINRPFSQAITQTFATGNVIPLVSGAFAEVNVEAQRLIVKCAKHAAAALEDKSDITPEEISSAKGSAYNLLL